MGMSLEAPTAGNRTVWPLVMAGLYLAGMVSAFCVAIPVSLSKIGGYCILYATTVVNGDRFRWQPAAQSNCDFVMGVGITCILFAALMMLFQLAVFAKLAGAVLADIFNLLSLVAAGLNAGLCLLLLIAAFMVSIGFAKWCSEVTGALQDTGSFKFTCEQTQNLDGWVVNGDPVDPQYYDQLYIAQAAVWICLLLWLVITGLGVWNLWRVGGIPLVGRPQSRGREGAGPPETAMENPTKY